MKFLALAFAGAVICCAGSVRAESVYSQCCGPLYYHVHHDGTITGDYPKQSGQIYGSVSADDTARGIWTQPRSDHPCSHPRGGSYAWGRFVIRDVGGPGMSGEWGYCDQIPDQDWGFH